MSAPILVTGACGGIGSAVITHLLQQGLGIVATDRNAPENQAIPPDTKFFRADLPEDIDKLVSTLPGSVGGLVHVAGVIRTHRATDIEINDFDVIFRANVYAPLKLFSALHDRLQDGASVVFVGSLAGLRASPSNLLYGASKAALHNAAKSLAKEFAPRGIRINVVAPGLIDTGLTDVTNRELASLRGGDASQIGVERIRSIPVGRIGSPADVAKAVAFLLSDDSSFVTGTEVLVTGGGHL
tara:strand:+ start:4295 stop:5017 length:723 start_codon:yes stop_codon:yes gene_type:complete